MGNNHPTKELIQSITEYVNARYESADRVVSYETDRAEAMFGEELARPRYSLSPQDDFCGIPVSGSTSVMDQAPAMAEPMGSMPPETEAFKSAAPAPKKKSALRKLFSKNLKESTFERNPLPLDDVDECAAPQMSFGMGNARSLEELVNNPGESFASMLFRLIDEKGLTDPDVYNKAGVSRQTFSKIRSKEDYAPSKDTVIALAMALGLTLDEVQDLLNTAGFALSNSSKSDIVISYFFDHDMHDLDFLNETLYEMGFAVIGGK